jgi:nucleotide-binding universal stress UspA family protein
MLSGHEKVVPFPRPGPEPAALPGASHLIACVDGSAHTAGVCEHAAWLCARLGSSIELLHVDEPSTSDEDAEGVAIERGPRLKEADPVLDEARHRLAEIGSQADQVSHARGRFASIATSFAASADMLVMGRRGQGHEDTKRAFGDNVLRMVKLCPAPVFLAARTFLPISRALVVCDPDADASALSLFLSNSPVLAGLSLELASAESDAPIDAVNEDDAAAEEADPNSLDGCLSRDPYDMIVLSRRALLGAQSPDELSPLARKLMTWRVSLLVY